MIIEIGRYLRACCTPPGQQSQKSPQFETRWRQCSLLLGRTACSLSLHVVSDEKVGIRKKKLQKLPVGTYAIKESI